MKKITLFFVLLPFTFVYSQIIKVDFDTKFKNSDIVVVGKIIDATSFKTENSIYTNYTLNVKKSLKGNLNSANIIINSIGGKVGNEMLVTCPENNFEVNEIGIYFLNEIGNSMFEASYFGQSIVNEYDNLFEEIIHLSEQKNEGKKVNRELNDTQNRSIQATITNISPLNVTAGVGETITITGTDFGTTGPTAAIKVWTKFANNPASMVSHANGYSYISWSDTEIVFKVPSNAGTGQIWVGSGASHATSSQTVNIIANVRDNVTANNGAILPVSLPALQMQGIHFVPNTNFTDIDAIARTNEAMQQWLCQSGIDMTLDTSSPTTNLNNISDGLSVIYFDSSMSASTLGVTLTSLAACSSSGRWYVSDVDLAINGTANFSFTLANTLASEIDYYSVVLHELGHVRNLGHVLNSNHVMFPSIAGGQQVRTLHPNDIAGGLWVQSDSSVNQICGKPLMVNGVCPPTLTYVPDDIFEQKLIDLGYDSGTLDDYVPTANINTVTNLFLNNLAISDLTGIEDFIALENFTIRYSNITNLDLTNNTALINLNCTYNNINTINIDGLTNLELIVLFDNSISNINLSTNTSLIKFNGGLNPYTNLDFSNNPNIEWIGSPLGSLTTINLTGASLLEELYINDNQITTLDLGGKAGLIWLDAFNNNLNSINLTNTTALQYCNIYNNQLPSLNVSTNVNLLSLQCSTNLLSYLNLNTNVNLTQIGAAYNNITNIDLANALALSNITLNNNELMVLDFSNHSLITNINLSDNLLTNLNMQNGNNTAISGTSFFIQNNPNLDCVNVDDVTYSIANWTYKDTTTNYNINCLALSLNENIFTNIILYPNPVNNNLFIEGTELNDFSYEIYDSLGKKISKGELLVNSINVSKLQSGFYLIILKNELNSKTFKFIKQ